MIKCFLSLLLLFTCTYGHAQKDSISARRDSSMHRYGRLTGQLRNYFMATDNSAGITDYYANGISAMLGYRSPEYKHFSIGISAAVIYNVSSDRLDIPDPATQILNRYEMGLFDVTRPAFHGPMFRIENLHLRYTLKKIELVAGRQILSTP